MGRVWLPMKEVEVPCVALDSTRVPARPSETAGRAGVEECDKATGYVAESGAAGCATTSTSPAAC